MQCTKGAKMILYTEKNIEKSMELIQSIFFDFKDLLEEDIAKRRIVGFDEFNTLEQFINEQISKLEELENRIDGGAQ
jgi:hypothetical protein